MQIHASLNKFACFKTDFQIDLEQILTHVVLPSGLASFTIAREIMEVDGLMVSFPLHQFRVVMSTEILV